MSVKPIDTFITNSVKLFEVNPSQTIFSISYKCDAKNEQSKKKKTLVSFKTHNAHLSTNYKFNTDKNKDVSRLLSALGPKGVTLTLGKIEKQVKKPAVNKVSKKKKSKKDISVKDVVGLSTLMVNTDVKEYNPAEDKKKQQGDTKAKDAFPKKKKQNKNKGKKKR